MMNLKERKMIHRLYRAFDDVPGAYIGGGTKTTTVKGVVAFGYDMQEIRGFCGEAMLALMDGSLTVAERDAAFEKAMSKAEDYIARRKAAGWVGTPGWAGQ